MTLGKQIFFLIAILFTSSACGVFLWTVAFSIYITAEESKSFIVVFNDFGGLLYISLVASIIAIPAAFLLGTPSFFLLRYFGFLKWWSVCAIGTFMGALVGTQNFSFGVPWSAGLGLTSAFISWVLIVRSNLPLKRDAAPASHRPLA